MSARRRASPEPPAPPDGHPPHRRPDQEPTAAAPSCAASASTISAGEVVGPARAQRRRQDHHLLHDRGPGRARRGPGAARRARRHRRPDVQSGPARASATCRRSRRSSAASPSSRTCWPSSRRCRSQRRSGAPRLAALLGELGLTHLAKSPAYTLSGGERRRAEITRALVMSPRFILLDEPFAGIDPIAVTDIQQIIFHLKAPRHRRAHHRPQRPRDAADHRSCVHRHRRGDLQERHARRRWPPTTRSAASTSEPISAWIDRRRLWPGSPKVGMSSRHWTARIESAGTEPARADRRPQSMAIHQKLQAKLSQKLILTPSLQQAIKLLPMSTLELADMLNQEVVENPLLEEIPSEDLQASRGPAGHRQGRRAGRPAGTEGKTDNWEDNDYEYFFNDYMDDGYRSRVPTEVKELPPIENTLSTSSSLTDHLEWQLSLKTDDPRRAAPSARPSSATSTTTAILVASVSEIAQMGPWPIDAVEQALRLVQSVRPDRRRRPRPAGVPHAAAAPARPRGHAHRADRHRAPAAAAEPPDSRAVAQDGHVASRSCASTSRSSATSTRSRARATTRAQPEYVMPDVYIVKVDDQYVAVLNDDGLPQLRISSSYKRLLDKDQADADTRTYVKERFNAARWLLKSVEQRQKTIQKVATSIINFQRDFLDHGIEHLRPLVLRDVANDIGMHESTVSRVVTNKYMHTPQGVFEMKYFFHSGISSSFGDAVSSVTIKQRIRKIIEAEDARKPLSDSKIVSILQREGLVLARRTIAKYREELRIPTSNQREGPVLTPPAVMPPPPVVTVGQPAPRPPGRAGARPGARWPAPPASIGAITSPYIQKTGLALAGYHEYLRPGRVLIYGDSEVRYLQGLPPEARLEVLARSFAAGIPCVLATSDAAAAGGGGARPPTAPACRCCATAISTPLAIGKLIVDARRPPGVARGRARRADGRARPGRADRRRERHRQERVRARPGRPRPSPGRRRRRRSAAARRDRHHRHLAGRDPLLHGDPRPRADQHPRPVRRGLDARFQAGRVRRRAQRWDTARDYDRLGLDDAHHDLLGLRDSQGDDAGGAGPQRRHAGRGRGPQPAAARARRARGARLRRRRSTSGWSASAPGSTTPTTSRISTAEAPHEGAAGRSSTTRPRAPTSWSSPACRARGSRRRSTPSRIWATTASTTCPWRCCPNSMRCIASDEALARVAVVVDIRERRFLTAFPDVVRPAARLGRRAAVAHLPRSQRRGAAPALQRDAAAASAGARGADRRRHRPRAAQDGPHPGHGRRDRRHLGPHGARAAPGVPRAVARPEDGAAALVLTFESFGFKHGLPLGADLVFDVRFLPNPHFVPELRPQTGRDARGRRRSSSASRPLVSC